jgi:hypothetical protein
MYKQEAGGEEGWVETVMAGVNHSFHDISAQLSQFVEPSNLKMAIVIILHLFEWKA